MMTLPEIDPEFAPALCLGDQTWVVFGKRVQRCQVLAIMLEVFFANGTLKLVCSGYRLDVFNINAKNGTNVFQPSEIYLKNEDACRMAKWHILRGVSPKAWQRLLGRKGRPETQETCELFYCCPNASAARAILFESQAEGGMNERDRLALKANLGKCDHQSDLGKRPTLKRILAQLDLLPQATEPA